MAKNSALLAGLGVAFIFGFSFLFTKEGLDVLAPFHLLGLRFGLAVAIFVVLRLTGLVKIDLKGKNLSMLLLLSVIEPVVYFICETNGIKMTSSSETGMMIAMVPVVTTLLGIAFLDEKPSPAQMGFILLSVAGVVFIVAMKGNMEIGKNLIGTFVVLGAVVCAGTYNVLSRKLSLQFSPVEITYVMMWVGAIVFNGISVVQHISQGNLQQYFAPLGNLKAVVSIVYLGFLSSVVAYFLLNFMLSKLEAARSSVFTNLATVFSIIAGVTLGHEPFYWFNVVGGIMILLGVWGTNYYSKKEAMKSLNVS
ncbi:DMT family transporter [Biomaibacter acetigenes]|jgi:drug/metabolite transporter (DMT)-like permease|uniref:DMT family transporter n=1 Tax=Biomaibacter acetigenes TaxID=2316383 RepID=A0A3G2R3E2_9FIRM|nr:DMT family transporter [Biomaibacter acetigenes]AYO29970.1 DMT family transporter [Biomaibacter acetigenes]